MDTRGVVNWAGMLLCLCGARLALENLLTYGIRWVAVDFFELSFVNLLFSRVSASNWVAFLLGDPR